MKQIQIPTIQQILNEGSFSFYPSQKAHKPFEGIVLDNECWEITNRHYRKSNNQTQRIAFLLQGKWMYHHQFFYQLFNNEKIPSENNKLVLHKCNNTRCCNPDHLYLGTNQDNTNDMIKAGNHCYGSKNGSAILNEQKVKMIRILLMNEIPSVGIAK